AYAPDNRLLASGSGALDGTVCVWDLAQSAPQMKMALSGHRAPVDALAFSPDSALLASGGADKTVRLWDLSAAGPTERAVFKGHEGVVRLVLVSADGQTLTSVCDSGRIILWDLPSASKIRHWQLPRMTICSLALTHDARYLAAGLTDGAVQVFRLYPKN